MSAGMPDAHGSPRKKNKRKEKCTLWLLTPDLKVKNRETRRLDPSSYSREAHLPRTEGRREFLDPGRVAWEFTMLIQTDLTSTMSIIIQEFLCRYYYHYHDTLNVKRKMF